MIINQSTINIAILISIMWMIVSIFGLMAVGMVYGVNISSYEDVNRCLIIKGYDVNIMLQYLRNNNSYPLYYHYSTIGPARNKYQQFTKYDGQDTIRCYLSKNNIKLGNSPLKIGLIILLSLLGSIFLISPIIVIYLLNYTIPI
jgi:hypothetical protein